MDDENPIALLTMFEDKRIQVGRLGGTLDERQLLLFFLSALPRAYSTEVRYLEGCSTLDYSKVERRISSRYRYIKERGEVGLMVEH